MRLLFLPLFLQNKTLSLFLSYTWEIFTYDLSPFLSYVLQTYLSLQLCLSFPFLYNLSFPTLQRSRPHLFPSFLQAECHLVHLPLKKGRFTPLPHPFLSRKTPFLFGIRHVYPSLSFLSFCWRSPRSSGFLFYRSFIKLEIKRKLNYLRNHVAVIR